MQVPLRNFNIIDHQAWLYLTENTDIVRIFAHLSVLILIEHCNTRYMIALFFMVIAYI
jgi:hypothetical protein